MTALLIPAYCPCEGDDPNCPACERQAAELQFERRQQLTELNRADVPDPAGCDRCRDDIGTQQVGDSYVWFECFRVKSTGEVICEVCADKLVEG